MVAQAAYLGSGEVRIIGPDFIIDNANGNPGNAS